MTSHKKDVILPAGGAKPVGPYSPGIRYGYLVYTSGQIGLDPAIGKIVEGGVEAQARQVLLQFLVEAIILS